MFIKIILVICWITLVGCIVIGIKNTVTCKMHLKLNDAVFAYHMGCIFNGDYQGLKAVDYEDMEPYETTLFRLWDWGYTRILPADKFEIIKPFIK